VLVGMVAGQYVVVGALDILVIMVALDVLETDSSGPGLLVSALGIGGILGALATVALVGRTRLSPALAVGVLVTGVPLMLLPLGAVPATAAFLLAVSGAGKSFFDVAGRTLLQRAVPDHVLARVFGVQESVMTASIAVGAALAPVAGLVAWHWLRRLDAVALLPGPHLSLLRGVPSLRLAPLRVLEALSRGAEELDLPAGALVVREGDPGDRFYVVLDGEVLVSRDGQEVRRLGTGDSFGEIALLRHVPRTATVRALGPVRLVTLQRAEFLRVVGTDVMTRDEANAVAQAYLDEDSRGGQSPVEP
jgi:MFS family permease